MVCCHIFVQKSSTCSKHTQNSQCTVHITYGSSDVPLLQYNAELLVLLTSFEIFQETFCGTKAHPQEKKRRGKCHSVCPQWLFLQYYQCVRPKINVLSVASLLKAVFHTAGHCMQNANTILHEEIL